MSASYKSVLLRCLLDSVDDDGSVRINRLTLAFRDVYLARQAAGLPAEKPHARTARVDELTETDIRQLSLTMPFKKFAQLGSLQYDRDASRVRFSPALWPRLLLADHDRLQGFAAEAIKRYFGRISNATD